MRQLFSTKYSNAAFNVAMLILRVGLGVLMLPHGYHKLIHFDRLSKSFMDFLGIGSMISLCLAIFAELLCSIFLIVGLFSRLVVIPLIIVMCVAIFKVNKGNIFEGGEAATLFLTGLLTILFVGPGKISVDGVSGR